jgi:predicted ABC-type ATPase
MLAAGDKSASAFTHEEASYVTKRAQQAAFERKQNIVLDGVGDSSEKTLSKKIETAQGNGYKVRGYYGTVPVEVAIGRSDARGNNPNSPEFGRFVPHEVIRGQHASVARVLPAVAPKFDSVVLYDTTEFGKPRLLMQGGGGSITVVDQAGFDSFKAIGGG